MRPLDRPARDVLKPLGETAIAWAVFDPHWYLRTYPDVTTAIDHDDPQSALGYYLRFGQSLGHSPNRLFDEQWHRRTYPHIAEGVAAGDWQSAFDAYCRGGALDRSPHWLFDEQEYRQRNLTNDALVESATVNGYDHYLRYGFSDDRIAHKLFDPAFYLSHFDAADVAAIRQGGVFQHYLNRIDNAEPELRTSLYFDPEWYRQRYPEVQRDIQTKRWRCALHHYLGNEYPTAFDPLPDFSESWYLQRDPGLPGVVAAGNFRNGYMHFLRFGISELRPPNRLIDLAAYAAQPSVQADLAHCSAPDAFAHWLTIGSAGLPSAKPQAATAIDRQDRDPLNQDALALLPIAGRFGYQFDDVAEPALSVVMVVRDGFATTMATIASLRADSGSGIELVIVDCGSADETRAIERFVPGARILRLETDIGWSRAADAGRQMSTAATVLFLSANARITAGSIGRACGRLATDPSVGVVGGLILLPDGLIAQAGGILWNDASTADYMRGAPPVIPEANFVRDVDFCGTAFLLVRAELLSQIGGLDHGCSAGFEAVDLCLRVTQAGFRVVYDPSVMIVAGEQPEPPVPDEHVRRKHATWLADRLAPGDAVEARARHAGAQPHRILFIEDTVPLRRLGSGFVRANDMVRTMTSLGNSVTVFPVNGCDLDLAHVFSDMPETVEVMHTLSLHHLGDFLEGRPGYYDTVWIARAHNPARVCPILARFTADGTLNAQIVLDTEAVAPRREAMQARLAGRTYDLQSAMGGILSEVETCQRVVAVTDAEAGMLRWFGFPRVSVVGHRIEPKPTARSFAQRSGMLFVGAIHQADSPNLDSLVWFVNEVLPLIESELRWETRLTIAGYLAPGIDLRRFEHHPRITLRGPVADLGPLYDGHRIFVAPTRYAAGAPYKVLEAASHGLPVVATDVLREQLGWDAEKEVLTAGADDPAAFAAGAVALYRDEERWLLVREAALRRLRRQNGREDFSAAVASVLRRDHMPVGARGLRLEAP